MQKGETHMWNEITNAIEEIREDNSKNAKVELLKKHESDLFKKVLYYTYHPQWMYNVTSKVVRTWNRRNTETFYEFDDVWQLLRDLRDRKITGHEALDACHDFLLEHYDMPQELFFDILDKDLKARFSVNSINLAFPGFIPEFEVALAKSFDAKKAPDFQKEDWYYSRKLDGVRCIVQLEDGSAKAFTRKGKEIETIDALLRELEAHAASKGMNNLVIDGELCYVDDQGNENFQEMMRWVRKKDHQIERPTLKAFDFIQLKDFQNLASKEILSERLTNLNSFVEGMELISPVKMEKVSSLEELLVEHDRANEAGWEGLMIRKDVGYKGKRSSDLQKLKKFHDDEYTVLEVHTGLMDDGKGSKIEVVTQITIDLGDGNTCDVGSGFTREERLHFLANPNDIIGKIITVKYFEKTVDKNGVPSLRFPIFKGIHGDKREY
jgi:DNA ligase-1